MSSHELSHEMQRSKPIMGGKKTCSRCDEPHASGSAYCREHRAEYQRDWRKARTLEFRALKLNAGERK